jgi:hypothetical protein
VSLSVLYIILENFNLNLLSKMFVLTEIIDCIFLLFSKILSPVLSISPLYSINTDVAQDDIFLEIALRTLWTPQLHSDNVITLSI